MRLRGITDPTAKAWWRDYQRVLSDGNPLGLSFVEYVAERVALRRPTTATDALPAHAPWYVAACGHEHPWGQPCSVWTSV